MLPAGEDLATRATEERRKALHALMQAESRAFHEHGYRMPDDIPSLDRVYVEPSVVLLPDRADGLRATADAQPRPVSEVFATHERLLIQGEPGQGKTTVVKNIVGKHADAWLAGKESTEPAIRVPAVDLVVDAPLATLLRASVLRRFGIGLLQDLPESMFESSVNGMPWLLLVDGLDEIVDQVSRQRVVNAISAHAAEGKRTISVGSHYSLQSSRTDPATPGRGLQPVRSHAVH